MWASLSLFVIGFIFLIKGADFLVDGSSSIAKKFNFSNLFIGLTIVAFGTSLPELIISVLASFKESSDIALGNVIGSNISNTLLILGVVAVITPLTVKKETINKEIPFSLLAIVALFVLSNDFLLDNKNFNLITRIDGLILLLFFGIFIYYTFGRGKQERELLENFGKDKIEVYSKLKSYSMLFLGVLGLFAGGKWVVDGAIDIASFLGLSEAFAGLTIAAIGTSLPELASSAVAAKRGKADMAVGNIIGSNVFNFLWVIGLSSAVKSINYSFFLNIDMLFLFLVTVLLLILIYWGKKNILSQKEGGLLLFLYLIYLIFLVYRG